MQHFHESPSQEPALLQDADVLDQYFEQLRYVVYREIDKKSQQSGQLAMFRECGVLPAKCRYFFIQHPGDIGQLFERSGRGWVVSFCERIRSQDLFVRRGEAIERVILQSPADPAASPRVISSAHEGETLSFRLYVKRVVDQWIHEIL